MGSILVGCDSLEESILDFIPIEDELSPISGFYIKKISGGIDNSFVSDGNCYSAQGFAVYEKTAYRLYDSGYCQSYDISEIEFPRKISSFLLGSGKLKNHSNCAQFGDNHDDGPLLYVSGLSGNCFVEKIHPESSELVQTVTLLAMESFNLSKSMNIICGDDGNLWAFGSAFSSNALAFAKLRRPDLSEGDVTLSDEDILDCWIDEDFSFKDSVWQGGKVYGGYLYFVFGTIGSINHIAIYDIETHQKVSDLNLDGFVLEEPEDCEMVNGKIILTIYGGSGYYIIDLINKNR